MRPKNPNPGVGMPAALYLEEFGAHVYAAFHDTPYLVGSALYGKKWRDVDVRLLLDDAVYEEMGLGDPEHPHSNEKWVALVKAFSALGRQMTGLPIDFQIQQRTLANRLYGRKTGNHRSALGCVSRRAA